MSKFNVLTKEDRKLLFAMADSLIKGVDKLYEEEQNISCSNRMKAMERIRSMLRRWSLARRIEAIDEECIQEYFGIFSEAVRKFSKKEREDKIYSLEKIFEKFSPLSY